MLTARPWTTKMTAAGLLTVKCGKNQEDLPHKIGDQADSEAQEVTPIKFLDYHGTIGKSEPQGTR